MTRFEKKNTLLIKSFGEYLREHSDVLDNLPDDALLVMQIEGDKAFNAWSCRIAQPEPGQPVVYVKLTLRNGDKQARTPVAIEQLELQLAT